MSKELKVGQKAPLFTLENQNGEKRSLKDYLGKNNIVIYFYPKAMTPGCTVQACGIRDIKLQLKKNKTVVFGISPDPVKRLVKFEEKEELNFDLLSDEEHKVAEKYGAWGMKKLYGREYMGIIRSTYIIGKDGKIKSIMSKVKTNTHHEEILNLLKQI